MRNLIGFHECLRASQVRSRRSDLNEFVRDSSPKESSASNHGHELAYEKLRRLTFFAVIPNLVLYDKTKKKYYQASSMNV